MVMMAMLIPLTHSGASLRPFGKLPTSQISKVCLAVYVVLSVLIVTGGQPADANSVEPRQRSIIELNNDGCHKMNGRDLRGALKDFDEAIRIRPDFELAITNRIKVRYRLNDYAGVIEDYNELVRIKSDLLPYYVSKPTIASAFAKVGLSKQQTGDIESAIKCFEEAVSLDPHKSEYVRSLDLAKTTKTNHSSAATNDDGKGRPGLQP